MFRLIVIFTAVAVVLTLGAQLFPALYEYKLLKDLATRIAREYKTGSMAEVQKQVRTEYDMSRITAPADALKISPLRDGGYKVKVEYTVPLKLGVGEISIPLGRFQEIHFSYEVQS
ncbi:MAG: hypothetical protein HQL51_03300 [Magnetococcales bacterium]|nr:hypothetical protein [Magnetococcales bacterium]